jgi:hypothetical protein
MRETDLYEPVKRLFESRGYEVKAEIGPADVMAVRGDEPPVIVELKTGFSLALLHQAIERQAITDNVYLAVPAASGRGAGRTVQRNRRLCRRLGVGLITVRLRDGHVTVLADPAPYKPRKSKGRQARLLGEFERRAGDPNTGGSTRSKLVTAYRQDALRCAQFLSANGPTKAAQVAEGTGVPNARRIMADNHYGWFCRVATGIYALDPTGADKPDRADRANSVDGADGVPRPEL